MKGVGREVQAAEDPACPAERDDGQGAQPFPALRVPQVRRQQVVAGVTALACEGDATNKLTRCTVLLADGGGMT
ncbi:MAG: hypothetical protein WCI05_05105 [Myxococcales bacterium]